MPTDAAQPGELREDENYTTALYRAAIGQVNTNYYLQQFADWDGIHALRPKWNSAAGLWTLGWMLFRRMHGAALAYVGVLVAGFLVVFGLLPLFLDVSGNTLHLAAGLLLLAAVIVPGFWGNAWFHSHCRKRMAHALSAHTEVAQSCASLALHASQPLRARWIGAMQVGFLAVLGLLAWQFSSWVQSSAAAPLARAPAAAPKASGLVKEPPQAAAPVKIPALSAALVSAQVSAPASAPVSSPESAAKTVITAAPAFAASAAASASAVPKPAVKPANPQRFGLNVGLFAQTKNAELVRTKLHAAHLPTQLETLQMPRGSRVRVRVGPFTSQNQADAAALKVRALGLDAVLYRE
jgi:cell division septation protein DedD